MLAFVALALFGLGALSSGPAAGADTTCGVSIDRLSMTWNNGSGVYDPFGDVGLSGRVSVDLTLDPLRPDIDRIGLRQCIDGLNVSMKMSPLSNGSQVLRASRETIADSLSGERLLAGQEVTHTFPIVVPAGQQMPAGMYTSQIVLLLNSRFDAASISTGLETVHSEERYLTTAVRIPSAATIAFSGTSQRALRVDFGDISRSENRRRNVSFLLRATSGYSLRIESENRGRMINLGHPDVSVPYSLFLDGNRLPFDGSDGVSRSAHAPGSTLQNLLIELSDTTRTRAGRYSDTIRVSVLPSLDSRIQ